MLYKFEMLLFLCVFLFMIHCFLKKLQNDWNVMKQGWDAQVLGEASYKFTNALEAVRKLMA